MGLADGCAFFLHTLDGEVPLDNEDGSDMTPLDDGN